MRQLDKQQDLTRARPARVNGHGPQGHRDSHSAIESVIDRPLEISFDALPETLRDVRSINAAIDAVIQAAADEPRPAEIGSQMRKSATADLRRLASLAPHDDGSNSESTSPLALELRYSARNYAPLPVVLARGDGAYLYDTDGRRYIDMMSAYSAASHGHGHPRLLAALSAQAMRLVVPSRAYHNDQLGAFLAELCRLTGLDRALPMNTGAEAVETAIKAARRWGYRVKKIPRDRAEIIVADGNFHGRTTTIVGFSSDPDYRDGFGPFAPGFRNVPFGDLGALASAITPNTAAVLLEPIQGEAGIILPPPGYLAAVSRLCDANDVLLILDEVQSGLGRTGAWFAYEHENARPDGLILGKALGGGLLPVSAFVARADVMAVFTPGSHGSTFGGNALAAAVGLEALRVIRDERLVERSRELGAHLLARLRAIRSPAVTAVRGRGLWAGADIDPAFASAREVCERLMARGVLSKETHDTTVRFAPPLVISREDLDFALDRFADVLHELAPARAAVA